MIFYGMLDKLEKIFGDGQTLRLLPRASVKQSLSFFIIVHRPFLKLDTTFYFPR